MMPWFEQPELVLGPFTFHAFGLLVGVGVILGLTVVYRLASEAGLDARRIRGCAWAALIPGFLGAAAFDVVFYKPDELSLMRLVNPSEGMSSFGGFLGAILGAAIYVRVHRLEWLRYADVLAQGIAVGWVFGRLGCTFAHDHPGRPSDFFLAFRYPDTPRHDIGFYEFLYTALVIVPVVFLARRATDPSRGRPTGFYVALVSVLYGPARFLLDFLRADADDGGDMRHLGLTFAQYCSLAIVSWGALWFIRRRSR